MGDNILTEAAEAQLGGGVDFVGALTMPEKRPTATDLPDQELQHMSQRSPIGRTLGPGGGGGVAGLLGVQRLEEKEAEWLRGVLPLA